MRCASLRAIKPGVSSKSCRVMGYSRIAVVGQAGGAGEARLGLG